MDAAHLELSKTELNKLIKKYWYKVKPNFRQARGTIVTQDGHDEYYLPKNYDGMVKHTLQSPTVRYDYKDPVDFFRKVTLGQATSGEAYIYTFGDMSGVDNQLVSASRIRLVSSLASKSIGSVGVKNGSERLTSGTDIFTLNDVGRNFKKDVDSFYYKIAKYINPRLVILDSKYRGATSSAANYKIGDIGVHACVKGYVSGEMDQEDVILDGENSVTTLKTFNTLVSVSKDSYTGGKVTATNTDQTRTVASLAPAELEIERQTILLWPQPNSSEELIFRYYMKHPDLWLDSDRLFIPEKYHPLIQNRIEEKMLEFAEKSVPASLTKDILEGEQMFDDDAEDMSLQDTVPRKDGRSHFGDAFVYDKDEDLFD